WAARCSEVPNTRFFRIAISVRGLIWMALRRVLRRVLRLLCRCQSRPFIPKPMASFAGRRVWIIVRPRYVILRLAAPTRGRFITLIPSSWWSNASGKPPSEVDANLAAMVGSKNQPKHCSYSISCYRYSDKSAAMDQQLPLQHDLHPAVCHLKVTGVVVRSGPG